MIEKNILSLVLEDKWKNHLVDLVCGDVAYIYNLFKFDTVIYQYEAHEVYLNMRDKDINDRYNDLVKNRLIPDNDTAKLIEVRCNICKQSTYILMVHDDVKNVGNYNNKFHWSVYVQHLFIKDFRHKHTCMFVDVIKECRQEIQQKEIQLEKVLRSKKGFLEYSTKYQFYLV